MSPRTPLTAEQVAKRLADTGWSGDTTEITRTFAVDYDTAMQIVAEVEAEDVQSQVPQVCGEVPGAAAEVGDEPATGGLDDLGEHGQRRTVQRPAVQDALHEIGVADGDGVAGVGRHAEMTGKSGHGGRSWPRPGSGPWRLFQHVVCGAGHSYRVARSPGRGRERTATPMTRQNGGSTNSGPAGWIRATISDARDSRSAGRPGNGTENPRRHTDQK